MAYYGGGQGVPTAADIDNNTHSKKYTVNEIPKGKIVISKLLCLFLTMGALLLAVLSALAVFIFVPGCIETSPAALTSIVDSEQAKLEVNARLPGTIRPVRYKLQITPFLEEGNFTTNGFVSMEVVVKEPTDKIVININDIDIDQDALRIRYTKGDLFVKILDQVYDKEAQTYSIYVDRELEKDIHYKIDIKFVSKLNDLMQGFYRSSYIDARTQETRWMASTQFSPTDARRAFPCFDEPSYKATFLISICRPAHLTSLSNMPKKDTVQSEEMPDWFWDHYLETPIMSSYLVAFAVSDLQPFEFNSASRKYAIWSRKDAISQAIYSSNIAPNILQYYESYFNIPYPLPKMDLVAVPDFGFSAMENWGLITFRETSLLLDESTSIIDNRVSMAMTMAHELTHQWFGNLATPKWWDDLWLKEGFATYFEYQGVEQVEKSWNISSEFIIKDLGEAFAIDSLLSSRPISFEVHNSDQIRQTFDKISYSKGASIIRMMQNFLGEDAFKTGLMYYLNMYKYSNANSDDLWQAMTDKAHTIGALETNITVKDIMDTWAKQPGFPVVTAAANYNDRTVKLTQERFIILGKTEDEDEESTWWVPISYATRNNPNFDNTLAKAWMKNENETTISLDPAGWYLLNLKHTGYYIVNYDINNWNRLIESYMEFPLEIRAQLVGNSMDLARAGLLEYDIPFRFIMAVGRRDDELVPYTVAFDKLDYLYKLMISTPAFHKFDVFIQAAFGAAFDKTQLNESPMDTYKNISMKRLILHWSCKRKESKCVIQSRFQYRTWMTHDNRISPNLRRVVYCTAIREGGKTEWDFAHEQYKRTNVASEKSTLIDAMGCSSEKWILSKYLNSIINATSGIRKQDGEQVFSSVASNIDGFQLAFDFLRSNWKEINDYYGAAFNRVGKMVNSLTTYMNHRNHLEQLEAFKNEVELGTTKQAFENAIQTVKGNIKWMSNSYKEVDEWLDRHRGMFGL